NSPSKVLRKSSACRLSNPKHSKISSSRSKDSAFVRNLLDTRSRILCCVDTMFPPGQLTSIRATVILIRSLKHRLVDPDESRFRCLRKTAQKARTVGFHVATFHQRVAPFPQTRLVNIDDVLAPGNGFGPELKVRVHHLVLFQVFRGESVVVAREVGL